jgi:uncharacterized protein (DUF433 family)
MLINRSIPMKDRIAVSPTIHFGKPCVAGTRIPVQSVRIMQPSGAIYVILADGREVVVPQAAVDEDA